MRTSVAYIAGFERHSGAVFGYPTDWGDPLFGPQEWASSLRAVLEARDRFVCIELGAGWGPWLVATAAAARQRGIADIRLAGVEASNEHFQFMARHFRDNGLDPDAHSLFRGVIGTTDGLARFPKLLDSTADWGAQAVYSQPSAGDGEPRFRDYRGLEFETVDEVPCLSLDTLLRRYDRIDLLHCDIQGAEGEVLPPASRSFQSA